MGVTAAIFVLLAYDLVITSSLDDKQAFNGLNETLKAMAMVAVGFWLGSSNSGQKKDDTIQQQSTALAQSTPVAGGPTTTTTVDAKSGTAETVTAPTTDTDTK